MLRFAVGTYTYHRSPDIDAQGLGILIVERDKSGSFHVLDTYSDIRNPSYLEWLPDRRRLYAVSEMENRSGAVVEFTVSDNWHLRRRCRRKGPGRSGCHLTAVPEARRLYAASYSDGRLTGYGLDEGRLGRVRMDRVYKGSGPSIERQSSPHAHQVLTSPYGEFLYVVDLGSDTVWRHRPGDDSGDPGIALNVPPGYGPRHLAFDPTAPVAYLLCELMPKLLVAVIDPATGNMTLVQEEDTEAEDAMKLAAPAAVKVHPSGRTVAVSNRFSDTIAVFDIERRGSAINSGFSSVSKTSVAGAANGASAGNLLPPVRLSLADRFPCHGKTPRDIEFSPDGSLLFIANQDSHEITCRRFNPATGLPEDGWETGLETGSPVCVVMLL